MSTEELMDLRRELDECSSCLGACVRPRMKLNVLVVEDNPDTAASVAVILESLGHAVTKANTLAKAEELICATRPHVIILDLNLPDSRGRATLDTTQNKHPDIPIVVYSGLPDLELKLEAIRRGALEYAVKGTTGPFELNDLIKVAVVRHQARPVFVPLEKLVASAEAKIEKLDDTITKVQRPLSSDKSKG
jgi:DNA-binding NtrC family response regulator